MFKCAVLLALVAVAAAIPAYPVVDPNAAGTHWAVIVAGSNTWGNYRHQADACHAYQILIKNGYKAENIITMMYDDIAANPENPTKGVIINKPNGPDVYQGVKIDYKADQVTPDNFVKVLTGDPSAPGPVLKSTADDHVFINFVDHGGPGIIAFPSQLLSSSDLLKALTTMHTKNMYAKLVFYMEACESGSMFQGLLPTNIDIYATTAADATHSSYACYYDQARQTYLGDVYSVNWMEDSDLGKLATETIGQQYTIVKQKTNTSTVCEFGDTSIKADTLNQYQGDAAADAGFRLPLLNLRAPAPASAAADAVSSRDVDVAILRHKLAAAATPAARATAQAALDAELAKREGGRRLFSGIVASVAGADRAEHHMTNKVSLQDYSCVEAATKHFHARCFNLGQESWALEHTMAFASMCAEGVAADDIVAAIGGACPLKMNLSTAKHAEMKLIFA